MKKLLLLLFPLFFVLQSYGQTYTPAELDSAINKNIAKSSAFVPGSVLNPLLHYLVPRNSSTGSALYNIIYGGVYYADPDADDSFHYILIPTQWVYNNAIFTLDSTAFTIDAATAGKKYIAVPTLKNDGTLFVIKGAEGTGAVAYPNIPIGSIPLAQIIVSDTASSVPTDGIPTAIKEASSGLVHQVDSVMNSIRIQESLNGITARQHFDKIKDLFVAIGPASPIEVEDPLTGDPKIGIDVQVPIFGPVGSIAEMSAIGTPGDSTVTFSEESYPNGYLINVVDGLLYELQRGSTATPNDSTIVAATVGNWVAKTSAGGSGGHVLKIGATTLTQRSTLRVLSDRSTDLRDSSATSESILDLRNYLPRTGTLSGKPITGDMQIDSPDWYLYNGPKDSETDQWTQFELQPYYGAMFSSYGSSFGNAAFDMGTEISGAGKKVGTLSFFASAESDVDDSQNDIVFFLHPQERQIEVGSYNTDASTWGFKGIVDRQDYSAYYTLRSHINKGYLFNVLDSLGLSGGTGVDTTVLATRAHVADNYIPYSGTASGKTITGDFKVYDGFFLDRNGGGAGRTYLKLYNQEGGFVSSDGVNSVNLSVNPLFVNVSGPIRGSSYYPTGDPYAFVQKISFDSLASTISGGGALPSQTGNSGKYLTTNGTTASWGTISGSGSGGDADSLGGVPYSGYVLKSDVDATPTNSSTDPVSSDGVFDELATKLPINNPTATGTFTAPTGTATVSAFVIPAQTARTSTVLGTFEVASDGTGYSPYFHDGTGAGTGSRKRITKQDQDFTSTRVPFTNTNGYGNLTDNANFTYDPSTSTLSTPNLSISGTISGGDVVHLTENETIADTKTFTSPIAFDVTGGTGTFRSVGETEISGDTISLVIQSNYSGAYGAGPAIVYSGAGVNKLSITDGTAELSWGLIFPSSSTDYTLPSTGTSIASEDFVTTYAQPLALSGSATLNFPSTASTAVSDLTITVTGAAVGDVVSLGVPNGSVTATATFSAWVSATDTVKVRFSPKATEDPASGTFTVKVFH